LQELERKFGGVAKWGNGQLSFTPRDTGSTASGLETPLVVLRPEHFGTLDLVESDRTRYSKVRASYMDKETNLKKYIETPSPVPADSDAPPFTIGNVFNSQAEAEATARSHMGALVRGTVDGNLALAKGDPFIRDQSRILVTGFRDGIDGSYLADAVCHNYTRDGGISTTMHVMSNGNGTSFVDLPGAGDTSTPGELPGRPSTSTGTGTSPTTPDTGTGTATPSATGATTPQG
jgi:hypothetical protein